MVLKTFVKMKTAFGDPAYIKRVAQMQIQVMQVNPPAIPFHFGRGN